MLLLCRPADQTANTAVVLGEAPHTTALPKGWSLLSVRGTNRLNQSDDDEATRAEYVVRREIFESPALCSAVTCRRLGQRRSDSESKA